MRPRTLFALALVFCSSLLLAKTKNKIPELVTSAKYVYVTAYNGDQFAGNVIPADRDAVTDVQDSLRKWGYYKIAYKPDDADIIVLVRKGRYGAAQPGTIIHAGSDRPRPSVEVGANDDAANDPDDQLAVLDAKQGVDSPPLWLGRMHDGLNAPQPRLVQQLRSAVESSLKKKP